MSRDQKRCRKRHSRFFLVVISSLSSPLLFHNTSPLKRRTLNKKGENAPPGLRPAEGSVCFSDGGEGGAVEKARRTGEAVERRPIDSQTPLRC